MDDKKQSGVTPGEHGVEESTKGFPIVSKEDAENAAAFEMKKKNKDGSWETAIRGKPCKGINACKLYNQV